MKQVFTFLFIYLIFSVSPVFSQANFREGLEKSNPVSLDSTISLTEKLKIHQAFLDKAIETNDQLSQLYGYLHIFLDYIKADDFPEASRYLLEAKNIAEKSGNPGWKGWVSYRAGILHVRMNKEMEAIETYQTAVVLCGEAGDSLCLGESWEQLSAMNGLIGKYDEARCYFELAMPLLKKYGDERLIGTALNNVGSLYLMQGQYAEAIQYIKQAIAQNHSIGEYRAEAKGMNNLAVAYRRTGQNDLAIETYNKCLQFNKKHNFSANMIPNYMGLFIAYEAKGDFQTANEFLIKRYELRDSITGLQVQEKIAKLEAKYNSEQKELELQNSQLKLESTRRTLQWGAISFFFLLLLIAFGFWYWRNQVRLAKHKIAEDRENLLGLTKLLVEKIALLNSLRKQVSEINNLSDSTSAQSDLKENLFDQRILTKTDWLKFKVLFEKSYPRYLTRLRNSCPTLSEAEERLFLLIKLNLTRGEAADMLGISVDSVKKTRNRLRKRLELPEEASLEEFIKNF